jgi:hypothetical protein
MIMLLALEGGSLAPVCAVLSATSQLVAVESRELTFYGKLTHDGPLRGCAVKQFDASRSGDGFDCAICQEEIGEAEWI